MNDARTTLGGDAYTPLLPAVNIPCGWCNRTYGYVSTLMSPTRRRRSTRMTFWFTREVSAGDEEGVESGQAGSHDADVTLLYQRKPLNLNWLQCGHLRPFRRSTPLLHGAAGL